MNDLPATSVPAESGDDILFECPNCGKSLQIDARGSGFTVVCPDCKKEVQVPEISGFEVVGGEDAETIEIETLIQQFQDRIDRLEKKQQADEACFIRLADELVLIQAALDRINEIVEDRNNQTHED